MGNSLQKPHIKTPGFGMGNGKFFIEGKNVSCSETTIMFKDVTFEVPKDTREKAEDRAINLVFSQNLTENESLIITPVSLPGMIEKGGYNTKISKSKSSKPYIKYLWNVDKEFEAHVIP